MDNKEKLSGSNNPKNEQGTSIFFIILIAFIGICIIGGIIMSIAGSF